MNMSPFCRSHIFKGDNFYLSSFKPFHAGFFSDTSNAGYFKLCMLITFFGRHIIILGLKTLTLFQGHMCVRNINCKLRVSDSCALETWRIVWLFLHFTFTDPLTSRVVGAPQMILQPVLSIFPCSLLPPGTCGTPGLSISWCCLPTSSFVRLEDEADNLRVTCNVTFVNNTK